jgi:hypothetical protein
MKDILKRTPIAVYVLVWFAFVGAIALLFS